MCKMTFTKFIEAFTEMSESVGGFSPTTEQVLKDLQERKILPDDIKMHRTYWDVNNVFVGFDEDCKINFVTHDAELAELLRAK